MHCSTICGQYHAEACLNDSSISNDFDGSEIVPEVLDVLDANVTENENDDNSPEIEFGRPEEEVS